MTAGARHGDRKDWWEPAYLHSVLALGVQVERNGAAEQQWLLHPAPDLHDKQRARGGQQPKSACKEWV